MQDGVSVDIAHSLAPPVIPTATAEVRPPAEKNFTDRLWDAYEMAEAAPADMTEAIQIGQISPEAPEYTALVKAGVSPQDLASGTAPRHKLLNAGFVFNNMPLGVMEKPLLKGAVGELDLTVRHLLTQEEFDAVRDWQRARPEEYGLTDVDLYDVRRDMFQFLVSSGKHPAAAVFGTSRNLRRNIFGQMDHPVNRVARGIDMDSWRTYSDGVGSTVKSITKAYWQEQVLREARRLGVDQLDHNQYLDFETKYMQEHFPDIPELGGEEGDFLFDRRMRGQLIGEMGLLSGRGRALDSLASPFLLSGFRFPSGLRVDGRDIRFGNPDFTVKTSEGRVFRVNAMVLHLLSQGLSEMGDGLPKSFDQDYKVGNYTRHLYQQPGSERQQQWAREARQLESTVGWRREPFMDIQRSRVWQLAHAWASAGAPDDMRRLARGLPDDLAAIDVSHNQVSRLQRGLDAMARRLGRGR